MSEFEELFAIRRILVASDSVMPGAALLDAAADLARLIDAELEGLFVEDVELTRLAGLPFVCELSLPAGTPKPLDLAAIERDWRALAANMRLALEARAQKFDIRCSFRVVRGRINAEIGAAAEAGDLVVVDRSVGRVMVPVHLRPWIGASTGLPHSVLLLPGRLADISSVLVLYCDAEPSRAALGVAARFESRLRAAGHSPRVTVLCLGETRAAALRAETEARAILNKAGVSGAFHPASGKAELSGLLRESPHALLVLPASLPLMDPDEVEKLATDWQDPVLLVR